MTDKRNSNISIIKRRMAGIISAVLILVTAISFVVPWYTQAANEDEENDAKESKQAEVTMPEVSSSSYIVMSGSTSEVVLSKHETRKMQPGSITMLMTAMVVIDNMYNEDELKNTVTIDKDLADYGDTFKKGEEVSIGDLLTTMLVSGDAQSAEALALYSASSREIFINEMNSKCMQLGIMDTQFDNPGGRFSQGQYATAWHSPGRAERTSGVRPDVGGRAPTRAAPRPRGRAAGPLAKERPPRSGRPAPGRRRHASGGTGLRRRGAGSGKLDLP